MNVKVPLGPFCGQGHSCLSASTVTTGLLQSTRNKMQVSPQNQCQCLENELD